MSNKKYELVPEGEQRDAVFPEIVNPVVNGIRNPTFRIRALRVFTTQDGHWVQEGEWGGLVSGPENLSQAGSCWIGPDCVALLDSRVRDNAQLKSGASMTDKAVVEGNVILEGLVSLDKNAVVRNKWELIGTGHGVRVTDDARLNGVGTFYGEDIVIGDNAQLFGNVISSIGTRIYVAGQLNVCKNIRIGKDVRLEGAISLGSNVLLENVRFDIKTKRGLTLQDVEVRCQEDYDDYMVRGY